MGSLSEYKRKREFAKTPEPAGREGRGRGRRRFVVQMHEATRLHWDLRLEMDGTLKSWAVPKGPSQNPADKRLAVMTEDHPLQYLDFEQVIPDGQYGAGPMMVWDQGIYDTPPEWPMEKGMAKGELKLILRGKKLRGSFVLVRTSRGASGNVPKSEWLLIKHKDEFADPKWQIENHAASVLTGRSMQEIAEGLPGRVSGRLSPAELTGAKRAPMPAKLLPMMAQTAEQPFSNPKWLFEIKWDGVRALIWARRGKVEMRSRNGHDITAQYPELHNLGAHLDGDVALLDGEVVVLEPDGRSSFSRLQSRMHVEKPPPKLLLDAPVTCYLFDLLWMDGYDLRQSPLGERKELLRQRLSPGGPVRFSDHHLAQGKEFFALAGQTGLEGVLAKHLESAYVSKRSASWLKLKMTREVDAVVGGWTAPRASRSHFGALSLGLWEGKKLRYIGGVGSGLDEKLLASIFEKVKALETKRCPFDPVPDTPEPPSWCEPKLVARVKYGDWTPDRRLRHPSFVGLRNDADPAECVMDAAAGAGLQTRPADTPSPASKWRHMRKAGRAQDVGQNSRSVRRHTAELSHGNSSPSVERTASAELSPDRPGGLSYTGVVVAPALAGKVISRVKEIEKELFAGREENVLIEMDGKRQRLSNLNKVYWPEAKITKRELLAYYYRMAARLLPYLKDRPMVLRRYPDGWKGEAFFQKEAKEPYPEWMATTPVPSDHAGKEVPYFLCNDVSALLYLTNLGCIDHNPWPSRRDNLEKPDYLFFDLDPTDDTPYDTTVTVARALFDKLKSLGLRAYPKTSGADGLHLFVPLARAYNYEQARTFAEIVARIVGAALPKLVTMERVVAKRPKGRVLIDFVQNAFGRPLATAWCVRAKAGATVSAPLLPEELKKGLDPAKFTLKTMPARLAKRGDPWADFWRKPQRLDAALAKM